MSQLLSIETPDAKTDYTKSQSYYWLVGPVGFVGFVVAAAAVYKRANLHNHWFFGFPIFIPIAKYLVDLFFGIVIGMVVRSEHFLDRCKRIIEKLSTWLKKIQLRISWLKERGEALLGMIPQTRVMPDHWDRFAPKSQVKALETFLKVFDNDMDRKSLNFWKDRENDTKNNEFNFRISLGEKQLSKLNFQRIKSKEYLGIEFWRAKNGAFSIRTTDESQCEPREFKDVTQGQRKELDPHIQYWYSKLK